MNRVGDAGFLVGLLIAWTYLGTLNFEEMNRRVRSPAEDSHGRLELANQFVRVEPGPAAGYELPGHDSPAGSHLALFPLAWPEADHFHGLGHGKGLDAGFEAPARPTYTDYAVMPYWLFVVMGIGMFLGCVGKSAQVPLHTWLPDAMEGPTPVSALIHAATMVAAGVYLVGRVYPLFAPEVLLAIAYTGAVTLFVAATVALVQTDIKRVLAYSTCSQLGYMMLALGVGGWVAGLLHLITHAFFKALLFLGAGSVIHGCHHEQDLRRMGGLRAKMRVTAFTMLVGVLAIAGTPFFSGWYCEGPDPSTALGFGLVHPEHFALFVLPLVTAAMTGLLHVPPLVPGLRRGTAGRARVRARPRVAVGHDGAARRAGRPERGRRLGLAAVGGGRERAGAAAGPRRPAGGGGGSARPCRSPRASPARGRPGAGCRRPRGRARRRRLRGAEGEPRRRAGEGRRRPPLPRPQVVLRRAVRPPPHPPDGAARRGRRARSTSGRRTATGGASTCSRSTAA